MEEETELENLYDISSIWITIRTFESNVQDLIEDVVAESAVVERSVAEEREATFVPVEEPVLVQADVDQTGPSSTVFQSEKATNA